MSAAYRSKMLPDRLDPSKAYAWTRTMQANGRAVKAGDPIDQSEFTPTKLQSFLENRWIEKIGHAPHAVKHHAPTQAEIEAAELKAQQDQAEIEAAELKAQQDQAAEEQRLLAEQERERIAAKDKPYVKKLGRNRYAVMLGDEKLTGEMNEADANKELEKLV